MNVKAFSKKPSVNKLSVKKKLGETFNICFYRKFIKEI